VICAIFVWHPYKGRHPRAFTVVAQMSMFYTPNLSVMPGLPLNSDTGTRAEDGTVLSPISEVPAGEFPLMPTVTIDDRSRSTPRAKFLRPRLTFTQKRS